MALAPKKYSRKTYVKKPYKKLTKTPSKSLKRAIESIIHKNAESKEAHHSRPLTAFNSGVNEAGDIIRIVPSIATGTTDGTRIGDEIRLQRFNLKGHLILSTSNNSLSNARIAVRMMIVQPKALSLFANIVSDITWLNTLLKKGGTTTAFTGTLSDLYSPINTNAITKYMDKIFYLTTPVIVNTSGTTSVNTSVSSDYTRTVRFFNHTFKLKNKKVTYDVSTSSIQPLKYSPVLLIGYVHLDGTVADSLETQVSMEHVSCLTYEDA